MSATLQFDDEASRRIEAIYSTPDVVAQRQAVLLALEAMPGERVLDIGAGPGFLAAELAAGVAPDGDSLRPGRHRGRSVTAELMLAYLRYGDTFAKIDGAWLFAERNLYADWIETRTSHP